jgi:hypothetical protein
MDFLNPFLVSLANKQPTEDKSLFEQVFYRFETFYKEREVERDCLKQLLGVERYINLLKFYLIFRLIIPFMEIHLPGDFLLAYNELDSEDPQVSFYQNHNLIAAEIRKLGVFLNRYDTQDEVGFSKPLSYY